MSSGMENARLLVGRQGLMSTARSLLLWALVFLPTEAVSRDGTGDSGSYWGKETVMERIIKDAESVTYPPDNFWRIVQPPIPNNKPFPCGEPSDELPWRSKTRPNSVHQLRPGDIDVVGAMGDSLTCGNGAREFSPLGMLIEDRGVSFSGGGLSTWRRIITLPNIIKVFNPNLVGYSKGRGDFFSYNAQLNVAIPAAIDDDALTMARIFVQKMRMDPRINITEDWKVLSINIGQNDICSMSCFQQQENSPEAHRMQLQKAFDYLYRKVPRLYVNLIPILDASLTGRMPRSGFCQFLNRFVCPCLFRHSTLEKGVQELSRLAKKYQEVERELASSPRYRGRKDFTIEWQPVFLFTNLPEYSSRSENAVLVNTFQNHPVNTPDCVHLNQRGLAIVGTMLWRNMLEPVGNKTWEFTGTLGKIRCPTKEVPYLFTKENSRNYHMFGHQ